jgi:hypothetical protein
MTSCPAWVKGIVQSSPLLWSVRARLNRTYDDIVPTRATDVFVTGVWRSANTFARHLMLRLFPSLRFASHGHVTATLKLAQRRNVPTVVLIREPLDTVASAYLKWESEFGEFTDAQVDRYLSYYIRYYTYVVENRDAFRILTFETITARPEALTDILAEWGVIEPIEAAEVREAAEAVLDDLRNEDKPAAQREAPREEKAPLKQKAVERIRSNPKLAEARRVYERVVGADDVA